MHRSPAHSFDAIRGTDKVWVGESGVTPLLGGAASVPNPCGHHIIISEAAALSTLTEFD